MTWLYHSWQLPRPEYFQGRILSSQLLLLQPSDYKFDRFLNATENARDGDYDMDMLNTPCQDSAMILPHRRYDLLAGEFRGDNHQKYLQNQQQQWDPDVIFQEGKYLHSPNWPLPKVCQTSPLASDYSLRLPFHNLG